MSEATIENVPDLSQAPYFRQQSIPITSFFIKENFKCPTNSRNIEEIWEKCKKGEIERKKNLNLYNSNLHQFEETFAIERYEQSLIKHLVSDPISQKDNFPNWIKFLAGEKVRISGRRINVTTTDMNFTKMEGLVKCILEMLSFPKTFYKISANFQIDMDSIHIENFENYHHDYFYFDPFERLSNRYSFDILFDYFVCSKEPVSPSKSIQKYAQEIKIEGSSNFAQIVADMLENPGRFAYTEIKQAIYLKPQTFEEASDFFCKRYSKSHRLRLNDLLLVSSSNYAGIAKGGTICVYRKNSFNLKRNLLKIDFLGYLTDCSFKNRFQIIHNVITDLDQAIHKFNEDGNFPPLQNVLDSIHLKNFGAYNTFYINQDLFIKYWPSFQNQVTQLFADLKEIFDSASKIVKTNEEENHTQTNLVTILCNKISADPLLYSNSNNEIIAEYANTLLCGF